MIKLIAASPYFFFFNDTATTEIYTLSLHDALPIYVTLWHLRPAASRRAADGQTLRVTPSYVTDRKSTRLNSSHLVISYAVFCLKKKMTPALHGRSKHFCGLSYFLMRDRTQ